MKKLRIRFFVLLYCGAFIGVIILCHLASRTVTALNESTPIQNRTVIIIDAGHGGVDGGATSCTGILESHTNLQISLRLNDLMQLLGYETKMIRKTDTSVYTEGNTIASQKVSDLKNRAKTVNETDRGILVSIHQNTFSDSQYFGPQVFFSKGQENLASLMQNNLNKSLCKESNRKPKSSAGIYLMEHIEKPGILIECGFISNPEEAVKLNDPNYQNKLCCVIATTLSLHLSNT